MKTVTVRLDEEEVEDLDEEAENQDISRSEYIRAILEARNEDSEHVKELQTENKRLERKLEKALELRNEHDELVKTAKDERTLRRKRHEASLSDRIRWFFLGGE